MTRQLDDLAAVAPDYGAVVLDQWGVLHDGTAPYPGAQACLKRLKAAGHRLAVLSNSGKRAAPNAQRITQMGFAADLFDVVMTSGEALWRDMSAGRVSFRTLLPIERVEGDAVGWSAGLDVHLTHDIAEAAAILLMGLPDGADLLSYEALLAQALDREMPLLCTNPDRASPRAGGVTVTSPGTLGHAYAEAGGAVHFYGKPHDAVFRAVAAALALDGDRLLMVGDSLEHDIAGAKAAGWDAVFVEGGLHAAAFAHGEPAAGALERLVTAEGTAPPDYALRELR